MLKETPETTNAFYNSPMQGPAYEFKHIVLAQSCTLPEFLQYTLRHQTSQVGHALLIQFGRCCYRQALTQLVGLSFIAVIQLVRGQPELGRVQCCLVPCFEAGTPTPYLPPSALAVPETSPCCASFYSRIAFENPALVCASKCKPVLRYFNRRICTVLSLHLHRETSLLPLRLP